MLPSGCNFPSILLIPVGEKFWEKLYRTGQLEFMPWKEVRGATFDDDTWVIADEVQARRLGGCMKDVEKCDLSR